MTMNMEEATQRHHAMVADWQEMGHPKAPCSGHSYPLPDCPAPQVHAEVLPPIDPNCPHEDGPYHMWTCDGPFTVTCDNCGADGRITMTSGPEEDS